MNLLLLTLLVTLLPLISPQSLTLPPIAMSECERSLLDLFQGKNPNSAMIINSMGKSAADMGDYDDCIDFGANFCLLELLVGAPLPTYVGWCVPLECDALSLEIALGKLMGKNFSEIVETFGLEVAVRVDLMVGDGVYHSYGPYPLSAPANVPQVKATCINQKRSFSTGASVVTFVLSIFVLITFSASLLDYFLPQEKVQGLYPKEEDQSEQLVALVSPGEDEVQDGKQEKMDPSHNFLTQLGLTREKFSVQLLLGFSVIQNMKSLGAKERSPETQFLNGIRVLSMFYIILGHTNIFMSMIPVLDLSYFYYHIWKSLSFQFILGAFFAVDSFFFLSGALVTMALLDLSKKPKINWILVYFHRWWRLTPLYFMVIWIWAYLPYYFSDGPLRLLPLPGMNGDACEKYWWTNILYISNFIPWDLNLSDGCIPWGWYLSNDMQFFMATPFFLWLYNKNKKLGIAASVGVLVLSMVVAAIFLQTDNLKFGRMDWFDRYYLKPWSRVGPYFIGATLSILWKEKGQIIISAWVRLAGYICSAVLLLTTVYGTYTNVDDDWSMIENVLFFTLSRSAFILGLAILCYFMLNNYGVLIKTILSFEMWTPLARLTFGAYLVHPMIIVTALVSRRIAISWDIWTIAVQFTGFLLLSYAVSLILWLGIEKPFSNLEKIITTRFRGETSKSDN